MYHHGTHSGRTSARHSSSRIFGIDSLMAIEKKRQAALERLSQALTDVCPSNLLKGFDINGAECALARAFKLAGTPLVEDFCLRGDQLDGARLQWLRARYGDEWD